MRKTANKLIVATTLMLLLASTAILPKARHRHAEGGSSHSHSHKRSSSHTHVHPHHHAGDDHVRAGEECFLDNGELDNGELDNGAWGSSDSIAADHELPHWHLVVFGFELSVLHFSDESVELVGDRLGPIEKPVNDRSLEVNLTLLHQHLASGAQGKLSRRGFGLRIPSLVCRGQAFPGWVETEACIADVPAEWSCFFSSRDIEPPKPPPRSA